MNSVTLAQQLIRCPSVTPLEAGALDLLCQTLEPLGFTCHRETFEEAGTDPVENLYAVRNSTGPNLCFAGHVDVVPPGDLSSWSVDPFAAEIKNDMLIGRGAVDMKASVAAWVTAISEVIETVDGTLSLLITCDEEGPSINGTRKMLGWMQEHGHRIDACVVGEPTNPTRLGEMAKVGRRGSIGFTLTVTGTQGHVAYPHLADNPVTTLVNILHELKAHTLDDGTEFFPPSNLEVTTIDVGNPASNVIPAEAKAYCNIRFNDTHSGDMLESWVKQICDKHSNHYSLEARCSAEAFLNPPGKLAEIVVEAVKATSGTTPELSTAGGTSDARFIKDVCSDTVEYGLINETAHKIDEQVSVKDIETLTQTYQHIITAYFS